jgi:hypothetical protein
MSCSEWASLQRAAGAIAILSTKGRGRHSMLGTAYFWFLLGVLVTMSGLSFSEDH